MKYEILASRPARPGIKPLGLTREGELIAEAEGLVIDAKSPRQTSGGVEESDGIMSQHPPVNESIFYGATVFTRTPYISPYLFSNSSSPSTDLDAIVSVIRFDHSGRRKSHHWALLSDGRWIGKKPPRRPNSKNTHEAPQ